jgi:UTP--glucose-1-phosphate uridylyltransferase
MPKASAAAVRKMKSAGFPDASIEAFLRRLHQFESGQENWLHGDDLEAIDDLMRLDSLPEASKSDVREAVDQLVVLKLNGGLGTSMGLSGPKSLLEVKRGHNFLHVIAEQVLSLRDQFNARVPLVLMNSPMTRESSLSSLKDVLDLRRQDVPLDFLQNLEPKLRTDDHEPVEWPSNPNLEWCPPGHGDLYTSLTVSGMTQILLRKGYRWCFVSNADNLGAYPVISILAWMRTHRIPFVMEVVRGTPADRKGGHLARRNGRIVLRETAQVPDGDSSFSDIYRWKYYNTNSLWFNLELLNSIQSEVPPGPELPLIVNRKYVDPRDKASPEVIQLETAMGAAIGSIVGATAVEVPRRRFAPVKTTDDLLVAQSDAYSLSSSGEFTPAYRGTGPIVTLSKPEFQMLEDFNSRFSSGPPSLINCRALTVEGDVSFGKNVQIRGRVRIDGPRKVPDGTILEGAD